MKDNKKEPNSMKFIESKGTKSKSIIFPFKELLSKVIAKNKDKAISNITK